MKKIIIGFAICSSISAYAVDCKIQSSNANIQELANKYLIQDLTSRAIPRTKWQNEKKTLMKNFATGKINCSQMINKVPHIAWIGDSLSKDFHVTNDSLFMLQELDFRGASLFDDDKKNNLNSFFERVSEFSPVYAINGARVGGNVIIPNSFIDRSVAKKLSIDEQIGIVLANSKKVPNFMGIWIGHNDLDWKMYSENETTNPNHLNPDDYINKTKKDIIKKYKRVLLGLIAKAGKAKHKVGITVFNLANIERYVTNARRQIEKLRAKKPSLFPYAEDEVYDIYNSLKPGSRQRLIKFYRMVSADLEKMVLQVAASTPKNVKLSFSNKLREVDFGDVENLSPIDGWHLSTEGKNAAAKAAFEGAQEALKFSGII